MKTYTTYKEYLNTRLYICYLLINIYEEEVSLQFVQHKHRYFFVTCILERFSSRKPLTPLHIFIFKINDIAESENLRQTFSPLVFWEISKRRLKEDNLSIFLLYFFSSASGSMTKNSQLPSPLFFYESILIRQRETEISRFSIL